LSLSSPLSSKIVSWMNKFYMDDVHWKLPQLFYFLMSCSSALPSARQKSVFAYPKQSYGVSRICFEMTCQATMPSSSEKCLRVSKTESYTLSRICFEMTRQATMHMPSLKAWLCLADEQHISGATTIKLWSAEVCYIGYWRRFESWCHHFVFFLTFSHFYSFSDFCFIATIFKVMQKVKIAIICKNIFFK
jgi:hypothetical protein